MGIQGGKLRGTRQNRFPGARNRERLLQVASRRWAVTDGFHRLNGGRRPLSDLRAGDSCHGKQTLDDDMMMTQLELNRR